MTKPTQNEPRQESRQRGTELHEAPQWRAAQRGDHDAIIAMCLSLYEEDTGLNKITAAQISKTLDALAAEPYRGQTVVLAANAASPVGYAFLIAFYSNEWGGLTCELDELYVQPSHRSLGFGSALFEQIASGAFGTFTAITLIATPENSRARQLYERSGFRIVGTTLGRAIKRD